MTNGMTVTVALVAICVVNLILIWQVSTLADEVRGLVEDIAHTETSRMREDGGNDDED